MFDIEEAVDWLLRLPMNRKTEPIFLEEGYGRVAAEEIKADIMVPSFDRSAFDGYALHSEDTEGADKEHPKVFPVLGVIQAGDRIRYELPQGKAFRIMTGAPIPQGTDLVVKHEDTEFDENSVKIFRSYKAGNIMFAGEDVSEGMVLLREGDRLNPAQIGLLTGQGHDMIRAYKKPMISFLSTGNEVRDLSEPLDFGQIYNSSYYMLRGFLMKAGTRVRDFGIAGDETGDLSYRLEYMLSESDMVITTGGVSAGDYDLVPDAVRSIGGEILFSRVSFKPGGAMLAAVKDGKLILGLSGNPLAAAVGLIEVGMPYIRKLCGETDGIARKFEVILKEGFHKGSPRRRFILGKSEFSRGQIYFHPVQHQRNSTVSSLYGCDMIGEIQGGTGPLQAGESIYAHFLP
ncbi:MAG: molybdopterin molybdotransferase MoeA [Lachnospiraceae bacterium]|nr:molybdopterin molybdotransferase MoeA [Lachnospiraceae bacterium]